eukprot:245850_1
MFLKHICGVSSTYVIYFNNYIPTLYISWCFNNGCNNNNNINANSNGFNNYQPPVQDINGTTSAYNPPSSPTYTLKTDENEPVPIRYIPAIDLCINKKWSNQ